METIIATITGTLAGKAAAGVFAVWLLGWLRGSKPYKAALGWLGRLVYGAFAALSDVGTSKLGKPTWGPLEGVLTDVLFVVGEQAAAGLRSDNVEKLEAQVERLEAVESETRAAALRAKLEVLRTVPEAPAGAEGEVFQRALKAAQDGAAEKLQG